MSALIPAFVNDQQARFKLIDTSSSLKILGIETEEIFGSKDF